MSLKGDKTKQDIREKAYQLFAEKGFKDVTMKDICELTGLSRGGLYRHYESTEQIFLEIVNAFSNKQKSEVFTKIEQRIPATTILEELLSRYASEMIDYENYLYRHSIRKTATIDFLNRIHTHLRLPESMKKSL